MLLPLQIRKSEFINFWDTFSTQQQVFSFLLVQVFVTTVEKVFYSSLTLYRLNSTKVQILG